MQDLFDEVRKSRLIIGEFERLNNFDFTVFLGLYNADNYLDGIFRQLNSQIDQNFRLLIVDNCSSDSTWKRIPELSKKFEGRIKTVRNLFNFGGAGSLALNFDLIETDWWCAWHQDDFYYPNHIGTMRNSISVAGDDVIAMASDMGSISNEGKKIAIKPRANWLLKNYDKTDFFIANLRTQVIPFPATAFKTDVFKKVITPWHSTAFSDTESTMLMCSEGKFEFSGEITMRYRENEMSESHSINNQESLFGIGASLARVFSSDAFSNIAKAVDPSERKSFLKALNDSIQIRLGVSEYSRFIQILMAESCMVAWGYKESDSIVQVKSYFKDTGSTFTPELLSNILDFIGAKQNLHDDSRNMTTMHFLDEFLGGSDSSVNLKNQDSSFTHKLYNVIMVSLPYGLQKKCGQILLKLRIKSNPEHPWNFKWK